LSEVGPTRNGEQVWFPNLERACLVDRYLAVQVVLLDCLEKLRGYVLIVHVFLVSDPAGEQLIDPIQIKPLIPYVLWLLGGMKFCWNMYSLVALYTWVYWLISASISGSMNLLM